MFFHWSLSDSKFLSVARTLRSIGLGVRVFANGPGDLSSIPGRVIPKTQKMVLDASLLNTQHYKVRIKGKVEQSREGVAPSPTPCCSSYRKGSLRVTLDYGRQLLLNNAIVWMVSIHPQICNSLTKSLRKVQNVPITINISITVSCTIASLALRQGLSTCLSFSFLWFSLFGLPGWPSPQYDKLSFFLIVWTRLGHLFVSQNPREFCGSHSSRQILFCMYHFHRLLSLLLLLLLSHFNVFYHHYQH